MITQMVGRKKESELNPGEFNKTVFGSEYTFKETHPGQVVYDGEHNYYDDSDFYAIVPKDGSFIEIEYGTTRFCSYGCFARVDAPPSLIAEYNRWQKNQEIRAYMIFETKLWENMNNEISLFVEAANDNETSLYELEKLFEDSRWRYVLKALNNATRSKFRLSLQTQVLTWIEQINAGEDHYNYPLSDRQFYAIAQYKRKWE